MAVVRKKYLCLCRLSAGRGIFAVLGRLRGEPEAQLIQKVFGPAQTPYVRFLGCGEKFSWMELE